ncbi:hypothetical protein IH979_02250 [Patescibacteria group bacterium]|nr:hypothetical protein [Patescibacteria group bacterium]
MNKLGITRIEILIIALIIGLLGVMAVVAVSTARSRTRDAIRLSDVRQTQAGLELYFNDFNMYPARDLDGIPLGTASTFCLSEAGFTSTCVAAVETVYLDVMPATPGAGLKGLSTCGGERNAYCYLGINGEYRIQFELENNNPLLGLLKGINCATETGLEGGGCPALQTPLGELEELIQGEAGA